MSVVHSLKVVKYFSIQWFMMFITDALMIMNLKIDLFF